MYKNQLQEFAQRSCFNLPSYACIREGPDHGPRFKATVKFNGEIFESPSFFSTLRQAENAAADVALNTLAKRGPSRILAAKVLDESGVYKNLLQETAHRAGLNLPAYTTVRSGPGYFPVFSCTVELAGLSFTGDLAKTKKQAQKNAALSAWHALKQMSKRVSTPSPMNSKCVEEQEQIIVARFLATLNNPQDDHQKGHQRPYSNSTNTHNQNWVSSNFTPEMAMHQIWLQEQRRHLTSVGVSIPIVPLPVHVAPWTHPFYFPNQIFPYPINSGLAMNDKVKDEGKIDFSPQNTNTAEKDLSEHASSRWIISRVQTGGIESSSSGNYGKLGMSSQKSRCGINSFPSNAPFRAPAIQIRSVVPVCSPAPSRKTPPTNNGKSAKDVQGMRSHLGSLHI